MVLRRRKEKKRKKKKKSEDPENKENNGEKEEKVEKKKEKEQKTDKKKEKVETKKIKEKEKSPKKKGKAKAKKVDDTKKMPEESRVAIHVVGDSQVKGTQTMLYHRLREKTRVTSLPGKGNRHIRKQVEKLEVSNTSVVATLVSGNDLYLRDSSVGATEGIVSAVMGAVDDCGLKNPQTSCCGDAP